MKRSQVMNVFDALILSATRSLSAYIAPLPPLFEALACVLRHTCMGQERLSLTQPEALEFVRHLIETLRQSRDVQRMLRDILGSPNSLLFLKDQANSVLVAPQTQSEFIANIPTSLCIHIHGSNGESIQRVYVQALLRAALRPLHAIYLVRKTNIHGSFSVFFWDSVSSLLVDFRCECSSVERGQ